MPSPVPNNRRNALKSYSIPMQSEWRRELAEYIGREAKPVEKFGHQPRLYQLTRAIGEGLVYDDDVVYAAAWLHDLGVFYGHRPEAPELLVRWDNVAYALERAPALLAGFGFPETKVAGVLECIRTHQPAFEPMTLEATLLRDADILEQLGAIGILRTVCKIGRDTRFSTFTAAAEALAGALAELPGKLRLPRARTLAEARVRLHAGFLEGLREEAGPSLF